MRAITRSVFLILCSCIIGTASGQSQTIPISVYSAPDNTVWTVPDAPIIGVATAGNGSVSISFLPPLNDGGSPILSYSALCSVMVTGFSSPITINSLVNGVAQSCRVTAMNAIGVSAPSEFANTVTPKAPTSLAISSSGTPSIAGEAVTFTATITPTSASGTVNFNLGPGSTGCTPATLNSGIAMCTTTFTSSGLRTITANYSGDAAHVASIAQLPGGQSVTAPTITITPALSGGVVGVPYSAMQLLASGGVAPHQFTLLSGNLPNGISLNSQGLVNGTPSLAGSYNFTIRATDANNFSGMRAYSLVIVGAPDAPVIGTAIRGNMQVSVAFTAPSNTGGLAITNYTATCGAQSATATASPIIVTGLTNGAAVTCSVTAANAVGSSVASAPSNSVTPATVPDAPSISNVAASNATLTVSFTPNVNNGGAEVTLYNVVCGALSNSGTSSSISVTGLVNGVAVTCRVNAVNALGISVFSAPSSSVAPGVPPAFTSAPPPNGVFGVVYTHTVAASGIPVPSYSLTGGALPAGLTLNSVTGQISGTPSAATNALSAVISADNGVGVAATQSFSITIAAVAPAAPLIGTATPGNTIASIAFTESAATSAPNLDYTALCNPGNVQKTGVSSPVLVAGLSNGVLYRCSVSARNVAGSSAASAMVSVIPSATFAADLSISITNNANFVTGGAPLDYVVRVNNSGPAGVAIARVQDQLGPEFSAVSWVCSGQNGAQCQASGNSRLDQFVDLTPGSSVQIILTATPAATPETPLSAMVSVQSSAAITDPVPGNNVATDGPDLRGLFRNGFE